MLSFFTKHSVKFEPMSTRTAKLLASKMNDVKYFGDSLYDIFD